MIPLRDLNPTQRKPLVTYVFIAVNVLAFLFEFSLGREGMQAFVERFGVTPVYLVHGNLAKEWFTPLTSMFLHGGWMHILGNMWFLHIFGDNVEDELGRGRFVLFYIVCGLVAVAAQVILNPSSRVPMVGASGAIAGVLAGYVRMFPRERILSVVPIFFFLHFVELPAYFFIFIWFGFQVLNGIVSLGTVQADVGGVAFFAHIGGFLAGLVLIRLFPHRKRVRYVRRQHWRDRHW